MALARLKYLSFGPRFMENLCFTSLQGGAENLRNTVPNLNLENHDIEFYVIMTFQLSL